MREKKMNLTKFFALMMTLVMALTLPLYAHGADLDQEGKTDTVNEVKGKTEKVVVINKKELNSDKFVAGAKLQIKQGDSIVKEFVSKEVGNEVSLEPGSYQLVEVSAPAGYEVAAPVDFEVKADTDLEYTGSYQGYRTLDSNIGASVHKLEVSPYDKDGKAEHKGGSVAYCYNMGKKYPNSIDPGLAQTPVLYNRVLAKVDEFASLADQNDFQGAEMKNKIMAVIANGYPYDKAGIKEKYGLSDDEFIRVTQHGVWHFTDKVTGSVLTKNEQAAFKELVNSTNSALGENVSLYIYRPQNDNGYYQNLLSIEFDEPNHVTMYDIKSATDDGKPEGPGTEEPTEEPEITEPEAPETPEVPKESVTPEAPKTPEVPEIPKAPITPAKEEPKTPAVTDETPKTPEAETTLENTPENRIEVNREEPQKIKAKQPKSEENKAPATGDLYETMNYLAAAVLASLVLASAVKARKEYK